MMNTGKKYYIVDTEGNYYKVDSKNRLVVARNSGEATEFSIQDANERIGTGRKSHFYTLLEVQDAATDSVISFAEKINLEVENTYEAPDYDEVDKPTMFDSLHNNWEEMLSNLCYMSNHMDEYQSNLNQMLSNVDKEICDIMHYLEFNDLCDTDMLEASRMLQERRRHRREIKDEMEKTALMRETFLDNAFGIKVHQSLDLMQRMKNRYYTPRKLNELFQKQTHRASA